MLQVMLSLQHWRSIVCGQLLFLFYFFLAIPAVPPPPTMRPAFVPHILQRPGNWPTVCSVRKVYREWSFSGGPNACCVYASVSFVLRGAENANDAWPSTARYDGTSAAPASSPTTNDDGTPNGRTSSAPDGCHRTADRAHEPCHICKGFRSTAQKHWHGLSLKKTNIYIYMKTVKKCGYCDYKINDK